MINDEASGKVADLHVKGIVPGLATPINSHIVTSVCLVDVNVALLRHIVELLRRVHTLAQRGGPRGGIDAGPLVLQYRKLTRRIYQNQSFISDQMSRSRTLGDLMDCQSTMRVMVSSV